MAEESVKRSVHHSIFKRVEGNTLQLIECRLTDCKECSSLKKGLYHCPLCPLSFRIRSRLKEHHVSVHWNSRISFADYNILKCKKKCLAVATEKKVIWWDKPHYHSFGCDNLFTKSRAQIHYTLHTVQPPVETTHICNQLHHPQTYSPVQTQTCIGLPQHPSSSPLTSIAALPTDTSMCSDHDAPEESACSVTMHQETTPQLMTTIHNLGPSPDSFTKGSSTSRLPCPHCSREFHPHSLKVHIDKQHKDELGVNVDNTITSTNYHVGVCVDERAGIFLVRRNRSGVSVCAHVQYCPNGRPPIMACQLNVCQQVMDTAARSGLQGYICSHLQSVLFLPKRVPHQVLTSGSLDYLINDLQLLRPSRKEECVAYQADATIAGVSMIVQLIGESHTSSRYLNFSVWDKDERKKWWSFNGRVCVTYDSNQHVWFCKHVSGSQSCIHKTIVKWYMAETKQFPGHLMSSLSQEVDNDDCDTNEVDHETISEPDMCSNGTEDVSAITRKQYPPQGNMAEEMTKYMLSYKRIPVSMPVSLKSGASAFPRRLVPSETHCSRCPDHPQPTEPFAVTKCAKLLTTTQVGLITGIEVCVKFCPRCNLPYRYQEFNDGVHNFNDFWIFSLGFMDLIRQFFKVHTAFSRVCQAVEGWLGLEGLPSSIIRNAYLHYKALCDHKYQYFCVLCGHHPPFLVTDADKKGMFDLSASELDVPEDNNDEVDADLFWNQVCLAMVYRGFLHTGLSDVHNPLVVKPSYKFWAPWIGRHSRASEKILNTEYKKCHHDKDVAESGTRHQMNVEDVVEILEQGSVKVLKELCQKLLIADTARQSKIDLIKKLKVQLGIPSEFFKVFSKFWGGSGELFYRALQVNIFTLIFI
ncbi:hypothetical protein QZH41_012181 [Actinostola sp. cb2023]|nr:hypothetical protein QZH41_012181 [Actinostola sp. cb2023]